MRTRIVGLSALAAVLAIALFGLPLAAIVVKYSLDDERGELERAAAVAAVSAAVELARGQQPVAATGAESDARLAVYDASGHRVIGDGPPLADPPVVRVARDGEIRSMTDSGAVVVGVPIRAQETLLGVVRASTPLAEVYSRITLLWLLIAGSAAVDVLAVWLIARRMAARVSRPLEDLAVTADALGHGDFSVRFRHGKITEIDSVAAALNSTAARLRDLVARERAFSADASHQMRTPLTTLRLGLEVALEDPDHDLRGAIVTAVEGTERLQRTVEDLLALARDSARSTEPLALGPLLDELAGTWRPELAAHGRVFATHASRHLPASGASTAAVRQILAVLVDNAATHGAGAVTVAARDAGGVLGIDVSDQGAGITIPAEQLFTRRDPSSAGHGIGLALARSLAEAEGGRLRLSKPVPATFTLLLPALHDNATGTDESGQVATTA